MNPLEELGERVARLQDGIRERSYPLPSDEVIGARVSSAARTARFRETRNRVLIAGVGAASVLGLALLLIPARSDSQSTAWFRAGEQAIVGQESPLLSAPLSEPLVLRFATGSTVDLSPGARAKVKRSEHLSTVALQSGRASLSVVPRDGHGWQVDAGPFQVLVVGTAFDVDWQPASGNLQVRVQRGEVQLLSSLLGVSRKLGAGAELQLNVEQLQREMLKDMNQAGATPEAQDKPPLESPKPLAGADWQLLAKEKKYAEAMHAVEARGLDRVAQSLDAERLLRLADVARYAGKTREAERVLEQVRTRFPGTQQAGFAAFTLGATAFDQRGDFQAASRAFETYLREQPSGSLRREALGRLMEAQHRLGNTGRAQATAKTYLKEFPAGPHNKLAKQLVGGK